jgi:hypothetical protein
VRAAVLGGRRIAFRSASCRRTPTFTQAHPDNSLSDGFAFGHIQSTVTPASSPYGNFQGSAVSGRVLQLEFEGKF